MISDMRKLRALREVAVRGTITAAAEAMGYTPSAISQQVASLEAELGVSVLERRGRNVVLTDAGRLLVEHSADVLAALERADVAIAELHGAPVGTVRIGAVASATAAIVPMALQRALAEHPGLEPEVIVSPLDENMRELELGTIDIAVDQSYDFVPHDHFDGFDQTVLLREPMLLLSPRADPVDQVEDTCDRSWIAAPAGSECGRSIRTITTLAGITPRFTYETDDFFATVALVEAGLAVAIVPSLAMQSRPTGVHVSVVPDARRTISAFVRPAARARPAISVLLDHLVQAAADLELAVAA